MSEARALAGWGRHPVRRGRVARSERLAVPGDGSRIAPRGLGRAYGDAALPAAETDLVLDTTAADRILAFDPTTGRLRCEAGELESLSAFLDRHADEPQLHFCPAATAGPAPPGIPVA